MKATITLLSALAIATSLSFGEDKPAGPPKDPGTPDTLTRSQRPDPEKVFKKLDANSDGAVSLDEFKAGPRAQKDPEKAAEIFKKIDADSNGSISLEEFKSHRPPHHRDGDGKGKRHKDKEPAPAPAPAAE